MTYRSFVRKSRFSEKGSATVATTATLPTEMTEVSQLSQVSQGLNAENIVPAQTSVANVATVAGVNSEFRQLAEGLEERAALIEYGTGVPRDWAEGFARLDCAVPAIGFSEERWRLLIDDGGRFLDQWAAEAAGLGWRATDVFGVHPIAPACRYDQMGLVPLIGGGEVVSITERGASIRTPGGSRLTYTRRSPKAGIYLWELGRSLDQPGIVGQVQARRVSVGASS